MKKTNMAVLSFIMILVLISCGGPPAAESSSAPGEMGSSGESVSSGGHFEAAAICSLDNNLVGSAVRTTGIITSMEDNPDGRFAMMEAEGCEVGIFAPSEKWEGWGTEQKEAFRQDNQVEALGTLVSFDGQLIIDLEGIELIEIEESGEAPPSPEQMDELDLPAAPESAMLDVPVVYSGSSDLPGLCYLGAAGMLVKYEHPELDFTDIIALSGIGSSALHVNFPDMPSILISPYMDQCIVFMAGNLGADYALGHLAGGTASDSFQPADLPFEDNAASRYLFENSEAALDALKRVVGSGQPVIVYINMFWVHDNFALDSRYWKDFLGKDVASHYMVIKGFDEENFFFNDPTDPTQSAGALSASMENFMQAWEDTADIPNAPPLGPFWMVFLETPGSVPDAETVIRKNLEHAVDAPAEIRSFAENPNDSEFARFLLLELGNARTRFGEYLERNGYEQAGQRYARSGELFTVMGLENDVEPQLLIDASDFEAEAIRILREDFPQ